MQHHVGSGRTPLCKRRHDMCCGGCIVDEQMYGFARLQGFDELDIDILHLWQLIWPGFGIMRPSEPGGCMWFPLGWHMITQGMGKARLRRHDRETDG